MMDTAQGEGLSSAALSSIIRRIDTFGAEVERQLANLPQDPTKKSPRQRALEEFRTKLVTGRNDLAQQAGVDVTAGDPVGDFIRAMNEAASQRRNPLKG